MGVTALSAAVSKPKRRKGAPERIDLETLFPQRLGQWQTVGAVNAFVRPANEPIYRIYEQVLERTYVDVAGQLVMLSVAYGGNQTDGLELHRPEVCYRYGGFAVRGVRTSEVRSGNLLLPVTTLVADKPGRSEAITYWATLAGELVPDASSYRLLNLSYAVRRLIVDGMLVRVSSIDPLPDRAYALHGRFIAALLLALSPAERTLVIGSHLGSPQA
jgi:EpsI family protein